MNKISERDYELLSAYLDGALNAEDTARVRARLASDPEFQASYDKLSATRTVLRAAPQFRVPRNFTITPEMAGKKESGLFSYNLMRLTSILASVLFVVVVMGDVVGTSLFSFEAEADTVPFQSEKAMDELAGTAMDERIVEGESIEIAPEEPEVMMLEAPAEDMEEEAVDGENALDDGDYGADEAPEEPAPEMAEPEIVEETAEEESAESEAPVLEEGERMPVGGGGETPTETPTAKLEPTPEPSIEPTVEPTVEPTATQPEPTATQEELIIEIPTVIPPELEPEQQDPMRFFRFLLLAVEFGLGGLAIGAGVTAFIMRRRS